MKWEKQEISQLTGYTLQVFFLNWIVICLFFKQKYPTMEHFAFFSMIL